MAVACCTGRHARCVPSWQIPLTCGGTLRPPARPPGWCRLCSCCGVQLDGFVTIAGTTAVVGGEAAASDAAVRVGMAARDAAIVVNAMLVPEARAADIQAAIAQVAKAYGCEPMGGVCCVNMKRFIPEGNKVMPIRSAGGNEAAFEIGDSEVYDVNITMSSGPGEPKAPEVPPLVYQRDVSQNAMLRIKASRAAFSEITERFPTMPFAVRQLRLPKAKFGLKECASRGLIFPFEVASEKAGEVLAQYRFTSIVRGGKTTCLTDHDMAMPAGPRPADLMASPLGALLGDRTKPKSFAW